MAQIQQPRPSLDEATRRMLEVQRKIKEEAEKLRRQKSESEKGKTAPPPRT